MRTLKTNNQAFSASRTPNKLTKTQPMALKKTDQNIKIPVSSKSPASQLSKFINDDLEEKKQLKRQRSFNILNFLDKKQPQLQHKYKKFENHSKSSDLNEVRQIILELLNKHAIERKLTSSEQYILTGYFAKYIQHASNTPRLTRNPFNIAKRLLTNNSPDMVTEPYIQSPSPTRKSQSKNKIAPKFKNKNNIEELRSQLSKELEMVKFLWQIYMLKSLTCPNLSKLSAQEEADNRRQLLDMVNKLKTIQQKRSKVGEQKSMGELAKIMKKFQNRITTCLL